MGSYKLRKYLAPGLLTVGFAAILTINWPGQMSYDSVMQLADGRTISGVSFSRGHAIFYAICAIDKTLSDTVK